MHVVVKLWVPPSVQCIYSYTCKLATCSKYVCKFWQERSPSWLQKETEKCKCLSVCAIMLYRSLKGFLRVSKTYTKLFKRLLKDWSFKRTSIELQESFKRASRGLQEISRWAPREHHMPCHREWKEKKIVQLTPSMILSSMTVPDYGKMCPNFCIGENLKIPNPWPLIGPKTEGSSQMRPSQGLWLVELNLP